jgi:D-alanine transaminase
LQQKQSGTGVMAGRIVYLNGDWLAEEKASISIFDRGFVMADSVYEVVAVLDGKLIDFDGHMARLTRSLEALEMASPASPEELLEVHRQLIAKNRLVMGCIYLQISRGNPGDRDFLFPDPPVPPTLVLYTQARPDLLDTNRAKRGLQIISLPDQRWLRRDIKTTQLLWPSMAKMLAKKAGADDAWMVEDGLITEGTSNNVFIVKEGQLITRALSNAILHGITRAAVLACAGEMGLVIEERGFSLAEALAAEEAFVTSATMLVSPVVRLDGQQIGSGQPGPVARSLRQHYIAAARKAAC